MRTERPAEVHAKCARSALCRCPRLSHFVSDARVSAGQAGDAAVDQRAASDSRTVSGCAFSNLSERVFRESGAFCEAGSGQDGAPGVCSSTYAELMCASGFQAARTTENRYPE